MSTVWNADDPGDEPVVQVTPSVSETWHDVRDGDGCLLGQLHHPAPRAPWHLWPSDPDLEADLAAADLRRNPHGRSWRFTSRKAAVEWLRQRARRTK